MLPCYLARLWLLGNKREDVPPRLIVWLFFRRRMAKRRTALKKNPSKPKAEADSNQVVFGDRVRGVAVEKEREKRRDGGVLIAC